MDDSLRFQEQATQNVDGKKMKDENQTNAHLEGQVKISIRRKV
jgi:hypothetical protein